MEQAETKKPLSDIKDSLEGIEKIGLILAAVFYTSGVIVTSLHLAKLGIPITISLFRIDYLLIGIVALSPALLSSLIILIIMSQVEAIKAEVERGKVKGTSIDNKYVYLTSILQIIMVILLVSSYISVFKAIGIKVGVSWIIYIVESFFYSAVLYGTLFLIIRADTLPNVFNIGKLSQKANGISSVITFIIIYLSLFSSHVYPEISNKWGGGKPVWVFVKCSDSIKVFGSPKEANKETKVQLLYASESQYVFRMLEQGGSTVILNKDKIDSIRYPLDE